MVVIRYSRRMSDRYCSQRPRSNIRTNKYSEKTDGKSTKVQGTRLVSSADHHFLTPYDGNTFRFTEGHYRLDVFVHLLSDPKPIRLFSQALEISRDIATALEGKTVGLYFDWGPDASRYLAHVEKRPPSPNAEEFLQLLGETASR